MKKSGITLSIFLILIGWQLFAALLSNDVIMPYPIDVGKLMMQQVQSISFYSILLHTITRVLMGLFIAFISAVIMVFLTFYHRFLKGFFTPILVMMKSIPNISYIIIVLLWFGSEKSVTVIIFLILFPMIYSNLMIGLQNMDTSLQDVLLIYPESKIQTIRRIYIPMLKPFIQTSLLSGISLSFKVGVMAEIIGQVQIGIGRQLNISRLNLDMAGIFAWTAWIILLLIIVEALQKFVHKRP